MFMLMFTFQFQAKVNATGYMLSGDYKYIAFESNYTKVRMKQMFFCFSCAFVLCSCTLKVENHQNQTTKV